MKEITVKNEVHAPMAKVWEFWTTPKHIVQWNFASDDWETTQAENDVRVGGTFRATMAAKDGSESFDFTGTYTAVIPQERLEYTMDDDRKVVVEFAEAEGSVLVTETFEMEHINSEELQRSGWQAILDNFKKYAEQAN